MGKNKNKYTGLLLKKGTREVHVIAYIPPEEGSHVCPCGTRRGHYLVEVNGKRKLMRTEKVSRLYVLYGYTMMDTFGGCYLFCQHAVKHQENVSDKKMGLWARFKSFFKK